MNKYKKRGVNGRRQVFDNMLKEEKGSNDMEMMRKFR